MAFTPKAPFQAFFADSLITAFKSSGHLLIVERDTHLVWPGFDIHGAKTMNRIMNVSVLGDFKLYLPAANQSNVFSDVLFINLGPLPLNIYDHDGNFIKKITGVPAYVYTDLTTVVPYADPFFELEDTSASNDVTADFVHFTSTVAAKSLLLKGIGEGGGAISETLALREGTVSTIRKFSSFTSILNRSDLDLPHVTAKIPGKKAAAAWNYIASPGVTIGALTKLADLKQTCDFNRKALPVTITYTSPSPASVGTDRILIWGYADGSSQTLSVSVQLNAGTHTYTTATSFSAVVRVFNESNSITPTNVSLTYPATENSAAFEIIKPQTLAPDSIANDNYQPYVAARSLECAVDIPAGAAAGTMEITVENAINKSVSHAQIHLPANTSGSVLHLTEHFDSGFLITSCSFLKNMATVTYSNFTLTYPATNGAAAVVIVDEAVLVPNQEITTFNNPTVSENVIKITGTATGPIAVSVTGTNASGALQTEESVTLIPPASGTQTDLTGYTSLRFVTITQIFNNSTQDIEDFNVQQELIAPDPYFYHVGDSPLTGGTQVLDSRYATTTSNEYDIFYYRQTDNLKVKGKINNDAPTDLTLIGNNVINQIQGGSTPPDITNINSATTTNGLPILPQDGPYYNFHFNNAYDLFIDAYEPPYNVEALPKQIGPANAIINYPLPYLPPNKYIVYSAQTVSFIIRGFIPSTTPGGAPEVHEESLLVLGGSHQETATIFWDIIDVRTNGYASTAISLRCPATTFEGNEYPDFFVIKTRPIAYNERIAIDYEYRLRRPKLFGLSTASPSAGFTVTGINNKYQEQTVTIKEYDNTTTNLTPEFLFVTEVKNMEGTAQTLNLLYAPASDILYTHTPNLSPVPNKSYTHAKNGYVATQSVAAGANATLLKLPPPYASTLEVWCDSIDTTTGVQRSTGVVYLLGTNNSGIYEPGNPYNMVEEDLVIKPNQWTKTSKQYLYLFTVRTRVVANDAGYVPPAQYKYRINNLKIRTVIDTPPPPPTPYVYNNTDILYGENNIYDTINNPPDILTHDVQPIIIHGNVGAELFIEGKADAEEISESVTIGALGLHTLAQQYNHITRVINEGDTAVTGCWIHGTQVIGKTEVVFIDDGSAFAAKELPLEGNPPENFPPRNLTIISSVASTPGDFLYLVGVDGEGITVHEELPINAGRTQSAFEYQSLSRTLNMTGVDLQVGFTTEAEGVQGIAHYMYTTDNSTQAGVWAEIPFGAFLNSTRGLSASGPGLFFDQGSLNARVTAKVIESTAKLDLVIEDLSKVMIYNAPAGHDTTWVLPEHGQGDHVYIYIHNASRSTLTVVTRGQPLNKSTNTTSVKLVQGQSFIAVAAPAADSTSTAWITACSNIPVVIPPPPILFPVTNQTGTLDVSKSPLGTFNNHVINTKSDVTGVLDVILPDPASVPNGANFAMANYTNNEAFMVSNSSQLISRQDEFYCMPGHSNKVIIDKSAGMFGWMVIGAANNPNVYRSPSGTQGKITTVTLDRDSYNRNFLFLVNYGAQPHAGKHAYDQVPPGIVVDLSQNTEQFWPGFKVNIMDWNTTVTTIWNPGGGFADLDVHVDSNLIVSAVNLNLNNGIPTSVNPANQYGIGGVGGWVTGNFQPDLSIALHPDIITGAIMPTGNTSAFCITNAMCFLYDGLNWWSVRP